MANAWSNRESVDLYMDRSRNARFSLYQYAKAFRQVQQWVFDAFKKDENGVRNYLYTLIKYANPSITTISQSLSQNLTINHINYPADYRFFSSLLNYVDGVLIETKPTNYNQLSNLLLDSFRKPDNKRCYYLEDSLGWRILRGYGGALTNELTYLIDPSEWSIGTETDLIDAGTGVLTAGVSYTATSEVVESGVNYQPSQQFLAGSTTLTSGQVIPTSVLVNSNLPDEVQEKLCQLVAQVLQGSVSAFDKANFVAQFAISGQKDALLKTS